MGNSYEQRNEQDRFNQSLENYRQCYGKTVKNQAMRIEVLVIICLTPNYLLDDIVDILPDEPVR